MKTKALIHLLLLMVPIVSTAATPAKREPYDAAEFRQMRALDAWKKYEEVLSWGKGQCLAILDDGCDLKVPEWQATLPWGKKVIATWNSIGRDENCAPVPPGYHGTTVGYPSSLYHENKRGLAYNNFVAQVRCVTGVHLRKDEAKTMGAALQWVVDNHKKYNITAVNLSPLDDQRHVKPVPTEIDQPLKALRDLGIWVSAPCGNNNFTDGISWPACAEHCFAIGGARTDVNEVHLDRCARTDILVAANATSSANAYMAAASMILREAIEKGNYNWKADGPNLAEAMMAVFKKTGVRVHDPATNLDFSRLDLLAALNQVLPVAAKDASRASAPKSGTTFLGKDIPSSPDWKLIAFPGKEGTEAVEGGALVIKTVSEDENRAYFMETDLGIEGPWGIEFEVELREGIERIQIFAMGTDGLLAYTINLYSSGLIGCYDQEKEPHYQTVKAPGGKLESIRLSIPGKNNPKMEVYVNENDTPLITFNPMPAPKGSKPGISIGDDTNSYHGEAAWKKITIRPGGGLGERMKDEG
ncbi:MAG: hypothetical protein HY360_01620 [Verrucomicrobia bacterium]|nr:hypothetical protein [Verrucomicrobiota bacterium]